jgi:cell division protein FtsI/penicillin-binding protein 2
MFGKLSNVKFPQTKRSKHVVIMRIVLIVALLLAVVLCFVNAGPEEEYVAEWVDELEQEAVPVPQKITQIVDEEGKTVSNNQIQRDCKYNHDKSRISCDITIDREIFSKRLSVKALFELEANFKAGKLDCVISANDQNLLDATFVPIPTSATEKCFHVSGLKTCMQMKAIKYVKEKCFKADIGFVIVLPTGELELMAPQEMILGDAKQCK